MEGLLIFIIIYWVLTIGVILLPIILLRGERTRRWGVAYLVFYACIYLIFSLNGDYVAHNGYQQNFGGAGSGTIEIDYYWWRPLNCGTGSGVDKGSGRLIQEKSMAAVFFWPLLALDRAVFHPDQPHPSLKE
jgi:hypothetical protein